MRQDNSRFTKRAGAKVGYVIIAIGLLGIVLVFTFSTSNKVPVPGAVKSDSNFLVSGVVLPAKIDFANESVPVDYFDVKESLERELLINSYWHSQTLMLMKRSTRYFGQIEPILKKNNIPDDFKFLALAESGFTNVTSPAGAVGFWQFLPTTAKDYGLEVNTEVDERYHLEKSTQAACKFLQESYNVYKSWTMAAASYNMGRRGLNKQILRQYSKNYYDILLNEETARYLYRIIALKVILSDPQKYGFNLSEGDYYRPIPYSDVEVKQPIPDLALFAFEKGTNYKLLKLLNPWLRDSMLLNRGGKAYTLKIPSPGFRKFEKELKKEEVDKIISQSDQLVE
jgi:membrane-bound lytic murein transglycosylase D